MKAYNNINGKSKWSNFWGDKVPSKMKRVFGKSARQMAKKDIDLNY